MHSIGIKVFKSLDIVIIIGFFTIKFLEESTLRKCLSKMSNHLRHNADIAFGKRNLGKEATLQVDPLCLLCGRCLFYHASSTVEISVEISRF